MPHQMVEITVGLWIVGTGGTCTLALGICWMRWGTLRTGMCFHYRLMYIVHFPLVHSALLTLGL